MSKAKRKEYHKLMNKSEEDMRKRILKELNRFKDKDQFELEDYIIELEHKVKELNGKLEQYKKDNGSIFNDYLDSSELVEHVNRAAQDAAIYGTGTTTRTNPYAVRPDQPRTSAVPSGYTIPTSGSYEIRTTGNIQWSDSSPSTSNAWGSTAQPPTRTRG